MTQGEAGVAGADAGAESAAAARPLPFLSMVAAEASGAAAALIGALPQALSLGVVAFATLGPAYAGAGVVAALLASIVGNLVAGWTYAVRCQIVGPRSATTALVAALMAALAAHPAVQQAGAVDVPQVLALVFAAVALSGLMQLVLGLAGIGRAIKYVPYPVVAGFMNGIAIIIVLAQLRPILGLEGHGTLAATLDELADVRWGSVATALCVFATIVWLPRFTRRMPAMVGGLAAGIVLHYLIAAAWPSGVGAVVGPVSDIFPSAAEVRAVGEALLALPTGDRVLLQLVLAQAVMLAIVGALDALLAAVVCDGATRGRHDSNRVLIGQGLGNLAGGLLGAMPSQLTAHASMANFGAGGHTRLATLLHAAFAAVVLVALAPAVAHIPVAALSGVMLFLAYSLIDRWSGDLARRIRAGREDRNEMAINVGIVGAVAAAQVALNLIAALGIGIALAVAILLVKLSGSPVRRHLDGTARSSHKVRGAEDRERLRALAPRIRVLELQGELFFGTADHLQAEIDGLPEAVRFAILDFRRVHQIDATGARILQVIGQRSARRGIAVALSDVRAEERRGRYLAAMGLQDSIPEERWFVDLDRALEWAEDQVLERSRLAEDVQSEIPLERMSLFAGLSRAELERMSRAVERRELGDGDPVFLEGEDGDRLYLIARGAVSIKVRLEMDGRARRLATFTPGVMFGEMALVEGKHRSADAFAKGERVVLYSLSAARLGEVAREDPALALRLQQNLSRDLAGRLRATSDQLRALE